VARAEQQNKRGNNKSFTPPEWEMQIETRQMYKKNEMKIQKQEIVGVEWKLQGRARQTGSPL